MTDAREIIAGAIADIYPEPADASYSSALNASVRAIRHLTSAGYRILGPDEVDAVTVEKCATEMEVNWGHVCTPELRDAIRALKGGGA